MKIILKLSKSVVWLLLLIAIAVAGYYAWQNQDLRNNPQKVTTQELAAVLGKVSRLIELPTGETPQLATVTDASQLKTEQPFFDRAQNGDKILIYNQAKKAILFRPSTGKIIEVGPVTITQSADTPTAIPTLTTNPSRELTSSSPSATSAPLNLVLLNGTTTVGLTSQPEAKLAQAVPEFHIVAKDQAQKNDYAATIVVDLTNHPTAAALVVSLIGGAVGPLPADEQAPAGADLLIIVGRDQQS